MCGGGISESQNCQWEKVKEMDFYTCCIFVPLIQKMMTVPPLLSGNNSGLTGQRSDLPNQQINKWYHLYVALESGLKFEHDMLRLVSQFLKDKIEMYQWEPWSSADAPTLSPLHHHLVLQKGSRGAAAMCCTSGTWSSDETPTCWKGHILIIIHRELCAGV